MSSPVLEVADLSVSFGGRRRAGRGPRRIRVVDGVSLSIQKGEVLALVGESGCGKSTLARAILKLLPIDGGRIVLDGVDISTLSHREMRSHRTKAQMVFQDPYSSLDPLMTASEIIEESLHVSDATRRDRRRIAREMMASVGLNEELGDRYSYEFSGGQRQRIAIARALAPQPSLIVCDEPVSALDLSTQNQVIALLSALRHERNVSYLFISHDLAVVRQIADRIAVMYSGQIVEEGLTEQIFEAPTHPYTLALLSAIPQISAEPSEKQTRIILSGDVPKAGAEVPGCRFHTRCPFALEMCSTDEPQKAATAAGGTVACHLHRHGPILEGGSVAGLEMEVQ